MLERRERISMSWGLRSFCERRDWKVEISVRIVLHFVRRRAARPRLVSGFGGGGGGGCCCCCCVG